MAATVAWQALTAAQRRAFKVTFPDLRLGQFAPSAVVADGCGPRAKNLIFRGTKGG
jgi:hypothetical protein